MSGVVSGGLAEVAGVVAGQRICAVDGRIVTSLDDIIRMIMACADDQQKIMFTLS